VTVPSALTAPQLQYVWEAVHDRYARQAADVPVHSITFTKLTRPQRDALAGLLGRSRLPGPTVTVRIDQLDRRLLDSDAAMTARQVAELLCGPIVNRPAQRRAARQARERMWDELEQAADPRLAGWIHHLRVSGTGTRLAAAAGMAADQLVTEALAVAALLPADGIALARLAERATGDPHALDRGRQLRTLVLLAALHLTGEPMQIPPSLVTQRAVLATVGIYLDSLSTDVLVLGLRADGTGHVDRLLNHAADAGEPLRLTLRMLQGTPPSIRPTSQPLSVCENPSVVEAAAARLGGRSSPLVCTDGIPTTAVLRLLAGTRRTGAFVRVSADFDAAGVRITNLLAKHVSAIPWRYTADTYRRAIIAQADRQHVRLTGQIPDGLLDPQLATEMRRTRVAVYEEQQTDILLGDLRTD
jgi:uncharacterized protein (TIGR02679 family)